MADLLFYNSRLSAKKPNICRAIKTFKIRSLRPLDLTKIYAKTHPLQQLFFSGPDQRPKMYKLPHQPSKTELLDLVFQGFRFRVPSKLLRLVYPVVGASPLDSMTPRSVSQ
jgi:hypothetical protein